MPEVEATLYTTSTCAECPRVAAILVALAIPFPKKVIDQDPNP